MGHEGGGRHGHGRPRCELGVARQGPPVRRAALAVEGELVGDGVPLGVDRRVGRELDGLALALRPAQGRAALPGHEPALEGVAGAVGGVVAAAGEHVGVLGVGHEGGGRHGHGRPRLQLGVARQGPLVGRAAVPVE